MNEVLHFWFSELSPDDWWMKNPELDQLIEKRFLKLHEQAIRGELFSWRKTPRGRLAEIIVLDQFSRNIYRGKPQSFAADGIALVLAQEAVELGLDKELNQQERVFLYLPYMHSESLLIHEEAMKLFTELGEKENLAYEIAHIDILRRFGRYPHRNNILGRISTPEEVEFLKGPNSSF